MPIQDVLHEENKTLGGLYMKYIYSGLVILQVFIVYLFYNEFSIGHRIAQEDSPYLKTVSEIKYSFALTHNMILQHSGSVLTDIDFETVLADLADMDSKAKALLEDEPHRKNIFPPTDNQRLRSQINTLRSSLFKYKDTVSKMSANSSALERHVCPINGLNKWFTNFITQAEKTEFYIEETIHNDIEYFDFIRNIICIFYAVFSSILILLFFLFEKKKAADYKRIQIAHQQAEKEEQWLRVTMRSMGDGLITTDNAANITYINPVACSLTGWNVEDAIGRNIQSIFNIVNEKTRKNVVNPVTEVLKKKYIIGLANHTVLISKSGKEYPIADSGAPIIDRKGDCIGTVLVFHDVSDRVESEKQLRTAHQQWERSFNAIKDIITIHDKDMRILRTNTAACAVFNVKEEELVGRYCYEVFGETGKPCPLCPLVDGNQKAIHSETVLKHKNLEKTFLISIAPVFNEQFELEYFVHSANDITERVELEEDLLHARKMEAIGTLAGGIAHDFNNMLSAILGYTELSLETVKTSDYPMQLTKYLSRVEKASLRAKELVNQILTFSRKTKHDQLGLLEPHIIVKESLKLIQASLPINVHLQTDIDTKCGSILADPTKIQQVVMNLCTNAVQAMEYEDGAIRVQLQSTQLDAQQVAGKEGVTPGTFIKLSVTDVGRGIGKEILEHIFEPYFTTKKLGKGTGMGLAMVHGIVKEYHGMIEVESEVGKGTSFHVYFPTSSIEKFKEEENNIELQRGNERILIVDDEEILVGLHKISLENMGYHVTGMNSSPAALEEFKTDPNHYDLVITDYSMPHMSGKEFAQKILKIRPDMPIILITGFTSRITEEEAREIGIREFAMKPLNRKQLSYLIRKVLDA